MSELFFFISDNTSVVVISDLICSYESLIQISNSQPLSFESQSLVLNGGALSYDSLMSININYATPYYSKIGVEVERAVGVESIIGLQSNEVVAYEAILSFREEYIVNYTTQSVIQNNYESSLESILGISTSENILYETSGNVIVTIDSLFFLDILNGGLYSCVISYSSLVMLLDDNPLPFSSVLELSTNSSSVYEINGGVDSTSSIDYQSNLDLSLSNPMDYSSLINLSVDRDVDFQILTGPVLQSVYSIESLCYVSTSKVFALETLTGVNYEGIFPYISTSSLLTVSHDGVFCIDATTSITDERIITISTLIGKTQSYSSNYTTLSSEKIDFVADFETLMSFAFSDEIAVQVLTGLREELSLTFETISIIRYDGQLCLDIDGAILAAKEVWLLAPRTTRWLVQQRQNNWNVASVIQNILILEDNTSWVLNNRNTTWYI